MKSVIRIQVLTSSRIVAGDDEKRSGCEDALPFERDIFVAWFNNDMCRNAVKIGPSPHVCAIKVLSLRTFQRRILHHTSRTDTGEYVDPPPHSCCEACAWGKPRGSVAQCARSRHRKNIRVIWPEVNGKLACSGCLSGRRGWQGMIRRSLTLRRVFISDLCDHHFSINLEQVI